MNPTILHSLNAWSAARPEQVALRFLSDRGAVERELTFAALRRRALGVAAALAARGVAPGDRAILVFPPGLDFVVGFLGCLYARVVAVPVMPPRRVGARDASVGIARDCDARAALTGATFLTKTRPDLPERFAEHPIEWIAIDPEDAGSEPPDLLPPEASVIAFLQYTSGSTSAPRGVIVTHDRLYANLRMMEAAFGNGPRSDYVSWVPLHHDMGLILNVLEALHIGACCTLLSPVGFQQRPLNWLKTIARTKAEVAGGPNFAFDLCVKRFDAAAMQGVDLSGWRIAFNAAEPVRADTMARFARTYTPYGFDARAFFPCYGMAEATVFVSGGPKGDGPVVRAISRAQLQTGCIAGPSDPGDAQAVVGCGTAALDTQIAIVDPDTGRRCAPERVGEIRVHGPQIGAGYWNNPGASRETFESTIEGEPGCTWLRTGDLGFIDASGMLFVTGRLKDMLIVRGKNHYPQDIEQTVLGVDPACRPGHGAVVALDEDAQLLMMQEIERTHRHRDDLDDLAARIREAVSAEHDLSLASVTLVAPGAMPVTTSGKIQRQRARELWQAGRLDVLFQL